MLKLYIVNVSIVGTSQCLNKCGNLHFSPKPKKAGG